MEHSILTANNLLRHNYQISCLTQIVYFNAWRSIFFRQFMVFETILGICQKFSSTQTGYIVALQRYAQVSIDSAISFPKPNSEYGRTR